MGPKPATTAGDAPGGGLCADQVARYHADGLIVVPGFFAPAEVEPLRTALHADPSVGGGVFESMDTSGQGHDATVSHRHPHPVADDLRPVRPGPYP